jgi:hypothetical protein
MDSHQQPARAHPARDPTRTRVVGAFPDGQSALNLAAAQGCATSPAQRGSLCCACPRYPAGSMRFTPAVRWSAFSCEI